METCVEELTLYRAKAGGILAPGMTGPAVGPGTYDLTTQWRSDNNVHAPFNTTSERPPLSHPDATIPGPGSYDVRTATVKAGRGGVASCPFVSESVRFPALVHDTPGPGAYETTHSWPHKRRPHTYTFTAAPPEGREGAWQEGELGSAYYKPNHAAARRAHPRAAHFARYSARDAAPPKDTPGPGSYELCGKPKTLYDSKPLSMFATKTARSQPCIPDTPGPGAYDAPQPRDNALGETFAAFGSSAPRFSPNDDRTWPGPGAYTGELARRRAKPFDGLGTAPFVSTTDRFDVLRAGGNMPGPGAYDDTRPARRQRFGATVPFGSTVPRFFASTMRDADYDTAPPATTQVRLPRRIVSRTSEPGSTLSRISPVTMHDLCYDVKYDWPKPRSTLNSTFGRALRDGDTGATASAAMPGPGSYFTMPDGAQLPRGTRFANSNWSRDVRNPHPTGKGNPGPGSYYCDGTLLKKSFNQTIGADTAWLSHTLPY